MIYVIGASGQAKETAAYILDCKIDDDIIFVDKENSIGFIAVRNNKYPVILESDFLDDAKNNSSKSNVVLGLGEPKIRAKVAEKYMQFCNFPNIIHPSVLLLTEPKIGFGNVIAPTAFISVDCEIGNFNLINYGATIGHDCKIGDFNSIYPQSIISGNVKIGNCNLLGAGCAVIENISIGNDNTIGMGGVCLNSVENGSKYVGVPVRKLEKSENE
jgi:sugar O-acyltransferase (sialic acid O-acetyltransferase NeuD family)